MPTRRFEGKTALVTGGANGMGAACARQLALEGARVHILDRDAEKAQEIVTEITQAGYDATFTTVDVLDEDGFTSSFTSMLERFGGQLDVMIHIAGASKGGLLRDQSLDDWDWHYRV
ncbi:MAG: SDR family NAD(P)-dependent oxidoreductase, partial [Pseudomonadota bacterium]